MPFTPFHLGPAFGIGLPLRRWLHLPTFIVTSVLVDVEPFLVVVLGLNYPIHGYLHTFLFASLMGIVTAMLMFQVEDRFKNLYMELSLEGEAPLQLRSFLLGGVLGSVIHVLLDTPLYADIRPFYPYQHNPLYCPAITSEIYGSCILLGFIGVLYYAVLIFKDRNKLSFYL